MGIRSRHRRKEEAATPDRDPIMTAAAMIASTGDATLALGLVINKLLSDGAVTVESLAKVGLSREEVASLMEAFEDADTADDFEAALNLRAALRHYDNELAGIAGERGVSTTGEEYVALRSVIAEFAERNDVLDVRIAYRLMLAECPERLPGKH
jgi:hypothetical protein